MLACMLPAKLKQPTRRNHAATAPESPSRRAKDNERPLVEDIRLLGRILGDVIREQEGVRGLRTGRAHPQAVGGVPPRCRP